MEFQPLKSERVILRTITESDVDHFLAYRSDENVARYQYWGPFNYERAMNHIMKNKQSGSITRGKWFQLGIEEKGSSQLIGDCSFCLEDSESNNAEIGFNLSPAYQHRGLAFESLSCLISYLFNEIDVHRITARVDCDNAPCVRLLERLLMRREGHFIDNVWFKGNWGSEYEYAILAKEWTKK